MLGCSQPTEIDDDIPIDHQLSENQQIEAVESLIREYIFLHLRMMDPNDKSIPKRFFVANVAPGNTGNRAHALLGNLLLAIEAGRALVFNNSLLPYFANSRASGHDLDFDSEFLPVPYTGDGSIRSRKWMLLEVF
jgi:hypothetical protein